MSNREEFFRVDGDTREHRLREDGWPPDGEDMRRYTDDWCMDCDHHLDECECDDEIP